MTALMKLFQRFYYDQIGKKCLILLRRKFQSDSYLISWPVLLTCVDDMLEGNMAVLIECHNFHLSIVEQKLNCAQKI